MNKKRETKALMTYNIWYGTFIRSNWSVSFKEIGFIFCENNNHYVWLAGTNFVWQTELKSLYFNVSSALEIF